MKGIRLIVGLGNIGKPYEGTRHNAGFMFADKVAQKYGAFFHEDKKFLGDVANVKTAGQDVILLKPSTLMNLSGRSVSAVSSFYKIPPEQILVAHDELDFKPGTIKLKTGGGSAGHNGLKSIIACIGSPNFERIRIGIGHPREINPNFPVADYVLGKPSKQDLELIEAAIDKGLEVIEEIIKGDTDSAMMVLNEKRKVTN